MILPSYSLIYSIIFHHIPSHFKAFHGHMIMHEAMRKHHGWHLHVAMVNVNTPSGEDGEAIEIAWLHDIAWTSCITLRYKYSNISSYLILFIFRLVCPHVSTNFLSVGHRHLCHLPSDSTRGKTTPPKFASRKICAKDASVRQAKAVLKGQSSRVFTSSSQVRYRYCQYCGSSPVPAEVPETSTCPSLSIVDSDTETSPLFGEGTIMKEVARGVAAYESLIFQISAAEWQDMDKYRKFERQRTLFFQKTHTEKKAKKKTCLFLVKTRKLDIPQIVQGRAHKATKSCQECAGNCVCHQLSDFWNSKKDQLRQVLEGVLPST